MLTFHEINKRNKANVNRSFPTEVREVPDLQYRDHFHFLFTSFLKPELQTRLLWWGDSLVIYNIKKCDGISCCVLCNGKWLHPLIHLTNISGVITINKRRHHVSSPVIFECAWLLQPFRMMRGCQRRRWMRGDDRTSPMSTCVTWRRPNGMTAGGLRGEREGMKKKDLEDKRGLMARAD